MLVIETVHEIVKSFSYVDQVFISMTKNIIQNEIKLEKSTTTAGFEPARETP